MVPEGWEQDFLRKYLARQPEYGAALPAEPFQNGSSVRYVRITDIDERGILIDATKVGINSEMATKFLLNEGEILIARTGASVGKSYLYKTGDGRCAFAGYLIRLTPDAGKLLPTYLYQCLNSPAFWKWVGDIAQTGAQPNISAAQYACLPVLLPSLHEQRAITAILATWDRAIEQITRLIEAKRRLKQGLMQQLLTGKRQFQYTTDGWQVASLGEVTVESTERNKGKLPTSSVRSVNKTLGMVPMKESVIAAEIDRYKIVCHNWFAYNPMRLNIGSICRWTSMEEVLVSPDYVVFRCDESRLLPDYLHHYRSTRLWEKFMEDAGNGSVRVRIYYSDLAEHRLPLPGIDEQREDR